MNIIDLFITENCLILKIFLWEGKQILPTFAA